LVIVGHHKEVLVHVVELVRLAARHCTALPYADHRVLAEDGVLGADEGEVVGVAVGVEAGEDLLHVDTHVEHLAVVELVRVVAVVQASAVEALDQVRSDERGVIDELIHERHRAVVPPRSDEPRAAVHAGAEHPFHDLPGESVAWLLFHGLLNLNDGLSLDGLPAPFLPGELLADRGLARGRATSSHPAPHLPRARRDGHYRLLLEL